MQKFGRMSLLFLAGHLCCLLGFELSRVWAFFPGRFRWGVTAILAGGYLAAWVVWCQGEKERSMPGALLVVWSSVMGYLLVVDRVFQASALLAIGLLLLLTLFEGRRLILGGLMLSTLATLAFLGLGGAFWPGVALAIVLGTELYLQEKEQYGWSILSRPEQLLPGETRAEVSWRGFAQLYSACLSGEGEKFSRQVLADTVAVIEECGGVRESGSEHRGTYKFPSYSARRECNRVLLEYQEQLDGVLDSSGAPHVRLFFREL